MPKIRIDTRTPAILKHAVDNLKIFAEGGRAPRTQNFGAAVAILMLRASPRTTRSDLTPLIFTPDAGPTLSTNDLQRKVCDGIFEKQEDFVPPDAEGPIYKPFTGSFKALSSSKHNNWRNSFDLQVGLGCDAPYSDAFLKSRVFLAEERFDCEYRVEATGRCRSPAGLTGRERTCFNPNKRDIPPGPESDAKKTAKLLTRGRDSIGNDGYWIIEPTEQVLLDLLGDPSYRVPLYPFMAGVYSGSVLLRPFGTRVDRDRFQADIKLDDIQFTSIFNPDPSSAQNSAFLSQIGITKTRATAPSVTFERKKTNGRSISTATPTIVSRLSEKTAFRPGRNVGEFKANAEASADPAQRLLLLEKATRGHARALDALASILSRAGYEPYEQIGGFDLLVETGSMGHLFEIKTWRPENLKEQIRIGVAQLYEYRWRNRSKLPKETRLYLLLDRRPPINEIAWIWQFLYEDRVIVPCWIENGRLTTLDVYAEALSWV